jgi:hypothetical protein
VANTSEKHNSQLIEFGNLIGLSSDQTQPSLHGFDNGEVFTAP